jgi:hypothetical protein
MLYLYLELVSRIYELNLDRDRAESNLREVDQLVRMPRCWFMVIVRPQTAVSATKHG